MRFYRLFIVALLLSITGFSFALTPSTQDSLNSDAMTQAPNHVNTPSEPQSLWLTEQIILLNNKITTLESQLPKSQSQTKENRQSLEQLKITLYSIKAEQVSLQRSIEQVIVENSQQYKGQNNRVDDLGLYINMWGLIFAGAVVFLGFTARSKAIKVAKETSEEKVSKWIEQQKESIINSVTKEVENELEVFKDESKNEFEAMAELRKNELDEHRLPF